MAAVDTDLQWISRRGICDHCGAEDEKLAEVSRRDGRPGTVVLCRNDAESFLNRDPVVTNFVYERLS